MIRFVFFDVGETLLCPQPSFAELATNVIRSRGHDVAVGEVQRAAREASSLFRQAADEGRFFSADADDSRDFWTTYYDEVLTSLSITDPDGPYELYRAFSDPGNYGLFPDARPTIAELRDRGFGLGVISNFEAWLHDLLDRVEVADAFDVVAISGPLGIEKPDPRIFHWALERAGERPEHCLHVGDSPFFDAEAARDCGMHGVLLDRHGRWTDLGADYPRIASLEELPPLLGGLGAPS